MTTYYGVWSGEEWWGGAGVSGLFCTTHKGVARAQARAANSIYKATCQLGYWRARAIGEDGLPVTKPLGAKAATSLQDEMDWMKRGAELDGMLARAEAEERSRPRLLVCKPCDLEACKAVMDASEEQHRVRSETASHKCTICGDPAVNWLDFPRFWNKDKDASEDRMYLCTLHDECQLMIDSERLGRTVKEIVSAIRSCECAEAKSKSHECAWCGDIATGWIQIGTCKWWHCDRCEAWAREASQSTVLQKRREP